MNRRNKRILDLIVSILCILLFPIVIFLIKKPLNFFKNIILVPLGKKTLVGYTPLSQNDNLPVLKPAIFTITDGLNFDNKKESVIRKLNFQYAKDYNVWSDMGILLSILKK
jgi:hypothetical protein